MSSQSSSTSSVVALSSPPSTRMHAEIRAATAAASPRAGALTEKPSGKAFILESKIARAEHTRTPQGNGKDLRDVGVVRGWALKTLPRERRRVRSVSPGCLNERRPPDFGGRSEEHTSELQSRQYLVCRLLLEKKKQVSGDSMQLK